MSFYVDMVEGLKRMIGPGKKYSNPTQMAKACGVAPNQIIRYIRQERGKHIQVVAKVLDEVGAKITFPDGKKTDNKGDMVHIANILARPDEEGQTLITCEDKDTPLAFSKNWLERKGDPAQMGILDVTGNSMSPRIEDGDMVIVDQSQRELFEGRIYAIRIDREIVIRRVAKEPGRILLISDNPDAEPRRISLDIKNEFAGWAAMGRIIYVAKDLP